MVTMGMFDYVKECCKEFQGRSVLHSLFISARHYRFESSIRRRSASRKVRFLGFERGLGRVLVKKMLVS